MLLLLFEVNQPSKTKHLKFSFFFQRIIELEDGQSTTCEEFEGTSYLKVNNFVTN